jgi:hypothetical protein
MPVSIHGIIVRESSQWEFWNTIKWTADAGSSLIPSVLPSLELLERGTTFLASLLFDPLEDLIDGARLGSVTVGNIGWHPHDLRQANERGEIR